VPTALITGITGQDGSYLAEHLLGLGYAVVGVTRQSSGDAAGRLASVRDRIELVGGDLLDQTSLLALVERSRPDEVYNLAAQSFVPASFAQPLLTGEVTALGVARLLEAVRLAHPVARVYQASSSEMFGKAQRVPQDEATPFYPRSPYGVAKLYGHWITVNYRESYGLHASSGILFNHESPRRGREFVTRKISHGVARIAHGVARELRLGNLDARRDWGYAGDYVRAMHLMLQRETPGDYVVATGETHSVREFAELAFAAAGLDWREHVVVDPTLTRPAEVDLLVGDAKRARDDLGWEPTVTFPELVRLMVEADLALVGDEVARGVLRPAPVAAAGGGAASAGGSG
jgi:GDPmannose 4,6-dehydratase